MNLDRVIIAVEGGGPTGGAERIAFDTIKLLSEAGHQVTIVSSAKEVDPEFAKLPNVDCFTLDLPLHFERFFAGSKLSMMLNLSEDREMKRLFSDVLRKIDSPHTIFHAHGFHNFFTQAILHVATGLKMKTVLTCHDFGITCPIATLFNYPDQEICKFKPLSSGCNLSACMGPDAVRLKQLRFARTWASTKAHRVPRKLDKILAVSNFEREILQGQLGSGVKVETLHNPITPASNSKLSPARSKEFLWIGRMTIEKDGVTPARVCKDLGLPITFVGDGPTRRDIEAANPDAKLLGWVDADGVQRAQAGARALILSSKWYETASLVVLECLAAGIPCVVPRTSAATDWIEDGVNGILFDAGDDESLAKALTLLSNDSLVETLSHNAFERYWRTPFTQERYKSELLQFYSEALAQ